MKLLVLDCCGASCGVCVASGGDVLARIEEHMDRGQDSRLIPMAIDAMSMAGLGFCDLDRIVVTRGPGSFTGVRVGLAAARGVGIAAVRPVIGLDRFSVYRHIHKNDGRDILVVIDSKRAELFCKYFPLDGLAHEACMMTSEQIRMFLDENPKVAIVGDVATPDDDVLFACARLGAEVHVEDEAFPPCPLYIRAPDVTVSQANKAGQ